MVFLPFGSVYATVDCLFHDDIEHVSHGIEIANDYSHSHDSISLDSSELLYLSGSGQNLDDTPADHVLENQCSGGLMISLSLEGQIIIDSVWKDPFSKAEDPVSLVSILNPREIRPPIAA